MKTIIETERIILRQFELEDAQAVFEFNSVKEVVQYTGDRLLKNVDEARSIITDVWFSDYQKYGYGRFAVVHKDSGKVIGFAGLKFLPEMQATDIGYRILPQYWRKGLTTEMAVPILQYGFETLQLEEIIAHVMPSNPASSRILEKAGLQFDKQENYPGEEILVNWYSIDRKKYTSLWKN